MEHHQCLHQMHWLSGDTFLAPYQLCCVACFLFLDSWTPWADCCQAILGQLPAISSWFLSTKRPHPCLFHSMAEQCPGCLCLNAIYSFCHKRFKYSPVVRIEICVPSCFGRCRFQAVVDVLVVTYDCEAYWWLILLKEGPETPKIVMLK